jgi:hypothetical protein
LGIYTLDKISENSIPHHLASGLYFIMISIQNKPEVHRIAVVN